MKQQLSFLLTGLIVKLYMAIGTVWAKADRTYNQFRTPGASSIPSANGHTARASYAKNI